MKLLALDQASKTSGWAVFEDSKLIDFGHLTLNDTDLGTRLYKLREFIKNKINEQNIDKIAFEDIQMQNNIVNNVQTFKALAEVYGIILELCTELKIQYEIIPSQTWKSTLNIKGRARSEQKKNAQAFAQTTYKIKSTQDESDAICIGTHCINNQELSFNWD